MKKQTKPTPAAAAEQPNNSRGARPLTSSAVKIVTKPQPAAPLNDFQELICELTADVLLNGANYLDYEPFLRSLIAHQFRRKLDADPSEQYVDREYQEWRSLLTRSWGGTLPIIHTEPPATTVTERIRSNARLRLSKRFEDFINSASPEEVQVLCEIFEDREQGASLADANYFADFPLAEAFANVLDANERFVKVPSEFVELIQQQVDLLVDAQRKMAGVHTARRVTLEPHHDSTNT